MSWDTDFYTAVMSNGTFSAGVTALAYEYKADAVAPFATYHLINANSIDTLSGAVREGERRIQLNVWGISPTQAKTLAEAGAAGAQSGGDVLTIFERSLGYDSDEELFGYAIDFNVWFKTP